MKLHVMTYNIASGRYYKNDADITPDGGAPTDLSQCAGVIRRVSPDLCGINEINNYLPSYVEAHKLTGTEPDQACYLSRETGLSHHFFGRATGWTHRGDYGNAVISKYPILETEIIPIPLPQYKDEARGYEPRSISKVKLDIADGITLLQVHIGLSVTEAQNAIVTLCDVIDKTDGPIILMGDFNIRPNNFLLDRIRQRLTEALPKGEGYIHSFPSWTEDAQLPERVKYYPFCKIDYIFASHHFKILDCEVLKDRVSDHLPMTAVLELPSAN